MKDLRLEIGAGYELIVRTGVGLLVVRDSAGGAGSENCPKLRQFLRRALDRLEKDAERKRKQ